MSNAGQSDDLPAEALYAVGDRVPADGVYMCVPCGFVQRFREGDRFIECPMCLAGTGQGPDGFSETETDLWRLST